MTRSARLFFACTTAILVGVLVGCGSGNGAPTPEADDTATTLPTSQTDAPDPDDVAEDRETVASQPETSDDDTDGQDSDLQDSELWEALVTLDEFIAYAGFTSDEEVVAEGSTAEIDQPLLCGVPAFGDLAVATDGIYRSIEGVTDKDVWCFTVSLWPLPYGSDEEFQSVGEALQTFTQQSDENCPTYELDGWEYQSRDSSGQHFFAQQYDIDTGLMTGAYVATSWAISLPWEDDPDTGVWWVVVVDVDGSDIMGNQVMDQAVGPTLEKAQRWLDERAGG